MLSLNETDTRSSSKVQLAVYKGLTVAVYSVDKTEISLSRQDLVELINVRSSLFLSAVHDADSDATEPAIHVA